MSHAKQVNKKKNILYKKLNCWLIGLQDFGSVQTESIEQG